VSRDIVREAHVDEHVDDDLPDAFVGPERSGLLDRLSALHDHLEPATGKQDVR
jgi:hypothetical protein